MESVSSVSAWLETVKVAFSGSVILNTERSFSVITVFVISIFSSESTITEIVEIEFEPRREICAVDSGTKIALSVLPILVHFSFSTQTTVNSIFPIRIVFPRGSIVPKRFVTTVGPSIATLSRSLFAFSVINVQVTTTALLTFS